MNTATHDDYAQPMAAGGAGSVQLLSDKIDIHELSIERPAVVAYLRSIEPGKHEIALVHAIEVGITELAARRSRFRTAAAGARA